MPKAVRVYRFNPHFSIERGRTLAYWQAGIDPGPFLNEKIVAGYSEDDYTPLCGSIVDTLTVSYNAGLDNRNNL